MTPGSFSSDELYLAALPHSNQYRVLDTFSYCSLRGDVYTIPAGFITDGASVPRAAWWLYPPIGPDYEKSAVLHDWVYKHAEDYPGDDHGHLSRGRADGLFSEAMGIEGFRESGRRFIWAAVRSAGWLPWRKHRKANQRKDKAA